MAGRVFIEAVGKATYCQLYAPDQSHRPGRFVWHHIQPEACGGLTVPVNLASLCDNCHYATHAALYALAHGALVVGMPRQIALAKQGYELCVAAGTVDKIPKEA